MQSAFHNIIKGFDLKQSSKIGIAVSGGVDSIVLTDLMIKEGFSNILLMHVNYGLRDEESDGDEAFVRNFAKKNNVKIEVLNAKAEFEKHTGIQEKARKIRYDWFFKLIQENKIEIIFTAHHKNDLSETVLLNLFRTTGLRGLTGIENQDKIIRPLLSFKRQEIEEYALANNIKWRTDRTNLSSDYSRNFIRNKILPLAKERFPNIVDSIADSSSLLKEYQELLDSLVKQIRTESIVEIIEDQIWKIDLSFSNTISQSALLLHELISDFGFNHSQSQEIIISNKNNRKGSEWNSKNYSSCLTDGTLLIVKNEILEKELNIEWELGKDFNFKNEILEFSTNQEIENAGNIFISNTFSGKIIKIRNWKLGDKISISKDGKSKKVSDVFTENHIPTLYRKIYPILEIENEIISIANLRNAPDILGKSSGKEQKLIGFKILFLPK